MYKIPPTPKVSGAGWGGEPPMKAKNKMMKSFKSNTGIMKGMNNKLKKIDKSARKSGF